MKTIPIVALLLFFGLGHIEIFAQDAAIAVEEPIMVNAVTIGETNALITAINKYRSDLGLAPLAANPSLSARAALAFPEVLNFAGEVDVTALRKDFAAKNVGILRGVVTHRGEKSGGEFPKYWAKDARWNELMTGDFTDIGAATARRSDGKLVAFAYLIKR